jgi:hypothetical protein
MMNDDMYRPTPEFREYLEWELTRAVRREGWVEEQRRRRGLRRLRWMRVAAVVLVSVAIGTTAGLAPAQIRASARRDSLLESARADAALAALRLELARKQVADVRLRVETGALGTTSLANAESELRAMEAQAMRARYNIEEINSGAQAPRDDLNAPLVGGRDYVKDRIQLDLMAAQQRLSDLEAAQAEAQRRARIGAGTELARRDADIDVARARATMVVLAERFKLRREFVEKGTPVEQLLRRLGEVELRQDAQVAQQAFALARDRLAMLEKQRAVGIVGELDVLKARLEVKEREQELQRLALRLRGLGSAARDSVR